MLQTLITLFAVIVIFNSIIIVHEIGHFLAAKWRGMKIEAFGVWFGKPIWQKNINGIQYCLGCIPAGGYVRLPQLVHSSVLEGPNQEKPTQVASNLDKIIVAFAGPLFSFLFAVVLAYIVSFVGKPFEIGENTTRIAQVIENSPAAKAGVLPYDKILEVNGKPVHRFTGTKDSIPWYIATSETPTIHLKLEREGKILEVDCEPSNPTSQKPGFKRTPFKKIGVVGVITPYLITKTTEEEITSVNNTPVFDIRQIETLVKQNTTAKITTTSGAYELNPSEIKISTKRYTYPTTECQIVDGIGTIQQTFHALFSKKTEVKAEHLSGPIGVLTAYYILLENDGWRSILAFSVLFNINLALINLLPLPILDGGHIAIALLEMISRHTIPSKRVYQAHILTGYALFLFFLYVTYFDIIEFIH
jgi:regulator of sigma E protease